MKKRMVLCGLFPAAMLFCAGLLTAQDFNGFKTINSKNIYCRTEGSGEAVVVVHGGPGLAHNYLYPHFRQISDNYRLIFYDQRGCGMSDSLTGNEAITIDTLVEELEGIRKAFGIKKINLAGQSFGALISINYTLKYPQNVKSMMLLEPAPGSTEYIKTFSQRIMERMAQQDKERLIQIVRSDSFRQSSPEAFKEFMKIRFKSYYRDTSLAVKASLDYFDSVRVKKFFRSSKAMEPYLMNYNLYDKLSGIEVPVLIIHGDWDPIPTKAIEKMHAAMRSSELHVVAGCGHFVHIEKPEEYFRLIREFLGKRFGNDEL